MKTESRRRPGPKPRISREQILAAARGHHLADLTMRGLAETLEVTPAALYRYFPDRDALVAALASEVESTVHIPVPSADWRAWLRDTTIELRAMLVGHPFLLDMETWPLIGATGSRIVDTAMGVLFDAGFDERSATHAYCFVTYIAYTSAMAQHVVDTWEYATPEFPESMPNLQRVATFFDGHDIERMFRTHLEWAVAAIPEPGSVCAE